MEEDSWTGSIPIMAEVTVRPTALEDEQFLWLALYYASHSNDEPGVAPDDMRANPDLIGYIDGWHRLGNPGVIALAREPVGAAWLRALDDSDRTNPVVVDHETPELAIAVLPGQEGAGIGTRMLEDLVDQARGQYPGIVLSVRVGNPAVRLYRRLGFEVVEEVTNRVGTRSLKMALALWDGAGSGSGGG